MRFMQVRRSTWVPSNSIKSTLTPNGSLYTAERNYPLGR